MQPLATSFPTIELKPTASDPRPGRKVYASLAETVLGATTRAMRAQAWYARHPPQIAMRCGDAWPPIDLGE